MNRLNQVALAHLFLRDYEATVEAGDPIVPRFSDALPLARRRPRGPWSDRRSEGGVREGHHGLAYLVRLSGPRKPALFRPEDHTYMLDGLRKAGWEG